MMAKYEFVNMDKGIRITLSKRKAKALLAVLQKRLLRNYIGNLREKPVTLAELNIKGRVVIFNDWKLQKQ